MTSNRCGSESRCTCGCSCAPALLFLLWCWQVVRRRVDARRYRAARLVPVRERFATVGELAFWLALIAALALTILALSRPQGITAIVRSPGVDIVLLMDGSTSMRVRDMGTDRWQRSMQWVRTLTKTLSWNGDRMALATFADIAVPQVRLTRDPNTILFFLDHLDDEPTFRLENDTSWNTNVEDAIYWGMKLVETDQQMYGPTKNAKTFVVISDGQVWSGNVAARDRAGRPARHRGRRHRRRHLERRHHSAAAGREGRGAGRLRADPIGASIATSLREIARAGGGEYFELGTTADEQIAARIIQNAARRSGNEQVDESLDELYWYLLAAAAGCLGLGVLFVKQRLQLGFGFAAALALLALISSLRS